jgi:hypothetical protein
MAQTIHLSRQIPCRWDSVRANVKDSLVKDPLVKDQQNKTKTVVSM